MTLHCETPYCTEQATHIVSRCDAIRDHFYGCELHANERAAVWPTTGPAALAPGLAEVASLPQPQLSLELTLAWWPPKHRDVTRREAKQIVAAGT